MTKFTLGTWLIENETDIIAQRHGVRELIATAYDLDDGTVEMKKDDEARGNARLIAAAPAMLSALHRCIAALAANDAPNCEAAKEARAAIALATGGNP